MTVTLGKIWPLRALTMHWSLQPS